MTLRVPERLDREDGRGTTAFYERVTAEESFKRNLSIPAQRAEAEELARKNNWTPIKHYTEPKHVQASVWQRPAFLDLVRDIEAGKVLRVVARHEDRIWRDLGIQQRFLEILRRHQVELWAFRGQLDYTTAHGRLVLQITGATAEFEKNVTGERIRKVKRSLIMKGRPAGGPPPFGYTSQSRVKADLLREGLPEEEAYRKACEVIPIGKSWVVDPPEAEVVRLIFRLFVDPGHRWGVRRITAYLNRQGYRRRSGLLWHPDKVRSIVNNPAVAGHLFYDEAAFSANVPSRAPKFRQTLYAATHEPIITFDVWLRAQRIKTENTTARRTKSTATVAYPLRDILVCGCGKPMKGKASGPNRPAYYICSDRKHFGPERCNRPVLRKTTVEAAIWKFLRGFLKNPSALVDYVREANGRLRDELPAGRQALAEKKKALTDVMARLARYHERFERAGNAGEEDFAWDRIKELRAQETQFKTEIAGLEARMPHGASPLDAVRARRYLKSLRQFFRSRPRYEEALYEALRRRHNLRLDVLAVDLVEAILEFDEGIEPSEEDDSLSRRRPMSPGGGKTMLARRLTSILPPLGSDETIEVSTIWSVAGLLQASGRLLRARPFRAPHHTISVSGLIGGGSPPHPGEVTLAHLGVLFLDELPEFQQHVLESLRQPLEDGRVTIARARGVGHFPARFQLVAAANPCRRGCPSLERCVCTPVERDRYLGRLSRPLLDRVDLHVELPALEPSDLQGPPCCELSAVIRQRVTTARDRARDRLRPVGLRVNAEMAPAHVRRFCAIPPDAGRLIASAMTRLGLSARGHDRVLKVARTIADLDARDDIRGEDCAEALQYRGLDRRWRG
jgi:site-specific DNA recombinase